ncbi:hypothetical protein ABTM86_19665, partial [Acinetobacter baumannii]
FERPGDAANPGGRSNFAKPLILKALGNREPANRRPRPRPTDRIRQTARKRGEFALPIKGL